MEGFDTSTDNLANLFVKKFYTIAADGENIPDIQTDVTNRMNMIANPNPIVRNVTLPTYRLLLVQATQQIDALRDNDAFNPIIDHLQNFYHDGIAHGLWDEFGPAPPPPELRRAGGSKKKKKKRKTRRRYF